jgi:2-(1,2-epoxy-1,2-dihydrophenyl)acetyl-CoA isomerase
MEYPDVIYKKEQHIATITLNRPNEMNSFSPAMSDSLYRALEDASQDKNIRAIIITAKGRSFCSGADVKTMAKKSDLPDEKRNDPPIRISIYSMMRKCDKPVIAAINGSAVGGGLDLALACDIRIASEKAKFSELYVRRGLIPASGGTYFLPRLVGLDRALLMLWTGDMLDAREAERIGLVTMVVPHEELEIAALELAEKLVKGPPLAIKRAKQAVYDGLKMGLEETLEYIRPIMNELSKTKDHKEGAKAFVEKREPVFRGE